jgi:hypothetical protein
MLICNFIKVFLFGVCNILVLWRQRRVIIIATIYLFIYSLIHSSIHSFIHSLVSYDRSSPKASSPQRAI